MFSDRDEILNQINSGFLQSVGFTLRSAGMKIAGNFIYENLKYNSELTNLETDNRIEQIPRTIAIVKENERIISKHDPINRFTKMKLDSYKKVRLERIGVQDMFLQQLGKIFSVVVLIIVLSLFFIISDLWYMRIIKTYSYIFSNTS